MNKLKNISYNKIVLNILKPKKIKKSIKKRENKN